MKTYIVSGWLTLAGFDQHEPPDFQTSVKAKTEEEAKVKANAFWAEQSTYCDFVAIET